MIFDASLMCSDLKFTPEDEWALTLAYELYCSDKDEWLEDLEIMSLTTNKQGSVELCRLGKGEGSSTALHALTKVLSCEGFTFETLETSDYLALIARCPHK
jgi:hypothetical protein